jgi:ketosteroid isomerase-like protein
VSAAGNKVLVLTFFEHLSAGRSAAAMELLDDEATWWVSGKPDHIPIGGSYTKATLPELMTKVYAAMGDKLAMTITAAVADGDTVVIEANPRGVSPVGRLYDNRNVFVMEVRGGKIKAVREYYDTMHTSEIFWETTYSRPGADSQ